jgi:glycosyltransferase involved in cell wall biosynthesis
MKVMMIILTSSQAQYAYRAYESIKNQKKHSFNYDVFIDVNSLNKNYINEIREQFKNENVTIIETESNGNPGKGHNSLFKLFKSHPEYDYLFCLDGDDMFYPCAFQQYEKLFENQPNLDIAHLMINDNVSFEKKEHKNIKLFGKFYLYTSLEYQKNWWKEKTIGNPFKEPLEKCRTPSRILIASRRIFDSEGETKIQYCEECKLYDDYLAFLNVTEAQLKGHLNTVALSDPTIYCYNAVNFQGATRNFTPDKHKQEQEIFNKSIENRFEIIKDDWDNQIKKLPWQHLETPKEFPLMERPKFCNENFVKFEINDKIKIASNALQQQDYDVARFNYNLVDRFGAGGKQMFMNWGKSLLQSNLVEEAINVYEQGLNIKQFPEFNVEILEILTKLYNKEQYYPQALRTCQKGLLLSPNRQFFIDYPQQLENAYIPIRFKPKQKNIGQKPVLVFHSGFHSGPFNGKNYQNREAVYGSEIAVIRVAELFVDAYNVFVFCQCDEELTHNGVHYQSLQRFEDFQDKIQIDILVVSRFINFFVNFTNSAKKTLFWLHDRRAHEMLGRLRLTNIGRNMLTSIYPQIDKFIALTEWHKDWFIKESGMPVLYRNKVTVIGNGVVEKFFANKEFIKTNRMIYCSDTSRGLEIALKCFPKIKEQIPDVILDIYFGSIPDKLKKIVNDMDGVTFKGRVPQEQLCEELMKSKILFYPVLHHETYCIVATEAMRAGCVPVTVSKTGIGEVVDRFGVALPGDVTSEDWQKNATEACINLLKNEDQRKLFEQQIIARGKQLTWESRKQQWLDLFS